MQGTHTSNEFAHLQDIFSNIPMVKRYTLLCLFFDLQADYDFSEIENVLEQGLLSLSTAIPHLKGHLIFEGKSEGNWGRAKILPLDKTIRMVTRDMRSVADYPGLCEFNDAEFPFTMLDPNVLIPEDELPPSYTSAGPYLESEDRPARVLVVQATFLRGGLILTFCSCHPTMDMNGLGQTICLFAKACCGEPLSDEERHDANQSRRDAIPLLEDDYVPGSEAKYFIFQPKETSSMTSGSLSEPFWAYVKFTPKNVACLKAEASKQALVPYITTNDAMSAFFWQRITKARRLKHGTGVETELNRQFSARRLLGLSDGYMGHMTGSTHNHEVDVWQQSLGEVAGKLRAALLDRDTLKFHVQAMATTLERIDDKTRIGYGATLDLEKDVILSSYAETKVCRVSFGPLLKFAIAARRPQAMAAPSCVYLMPKDGDGSMVAGVCLREDDWKRIREDEELLRYAKIIG